MSEALDEVSQKLVGHCLLEHLIHRVFRGADIFPEVADQGFHDGANVGDRLDIDGEVGIPSSEEEPSADMRDVRLWNSDVHVLACVGRQQVGHQDFGSVLLHCVGSNNLDAPAGASVDGFDPIPVAVCQEQDGILAPEGEVGLRGELAI